MRNILDYIEKIKQENEGPRITIQEPRNMELAGGYGSSTFDAHTKREDAFKAYKNYKKSRVGRHKTPILTFRQFLPIYAKENFADGGRIGFKNGLGVQRGIRREPGLLRIAEAFQKADITDDFEYLMRSKESTKAWEKYSGKKQRIYKKGMISTGDMVYINQLAKNPADLQFIAESLGEDTDWVLDKLEERSQYVEDVKRERGIAKEATKYQKPRKDYLKIENWMQKNAKRYATPESFEKALLKRFGNKNQFIMDMKSGKNSVTTHFSAEFKKLMLNSDAAKTMIKPTHLKQLISSSLYNFNPKVKAKVTAEIKNIFNVENLPKLRTEAKKMIRNNKTLAMFELDKTITGPFPKVIQAEIGRKLWDDIQAFKQPRVNTYEMLKAFEDLVPKEFKSMFEESAKAVKFSRDKEWKKAKDAFGLADNIAWDHKIPSSIIDKGYADIIEYTKVNPTSEHFNARIKNFGFDKKINRLVKKYEGVNTLDQKVGIVEEMNKVKSDFSKKYGNYLDDVDIKLDKKGNLRFSSTAKPLTTKMDRVKMLETSLQQEKFPKMNIKQQHKFLKQSGFNIDKCLSSGGRVKLQGGGGVNTCIRGVIDEEIKLAKKSGNTAKFSKFGKLANKAGWFLGWVDIPIELAFALPHMLQGDKEAAKRATTAGLFGWGEKKLDEIKADSPEAYKYAKHIKDNNDWVDAWFSQQDAEKNLEFLEDVPETSQVEKRTMIADQWWTAQNKMDSIQKGYVGYVDEEGNFDPMGGAKGKTALQDYLREDVKKKTDAGFQIDIDLPFYQKKNVAGVAPFKGGVPITNVKRYIEQKGEPYWNVGLKHAAEEAGVPDLYDTFMQGADIKDPRDLYSELPLEYASQLGKMEAEETRRLLAEKKAKEEADEAARRYGPYTRFAGGGMAGIRRPSALPPTGGPQSGGLPSLYNNGRKL